MRKTILLAMVILATAFTANAQDKKEESKVKHLTYKEFTKKVWDFEKDPSTFVYKGKLPAVIDFYLLSSTSTPTGAVRAAVWHLLWRS